MGRGAEFLQRHTVGWQTHVKIFTIIDYKGNEIKITMSYHLTLPKDEKQQVLESTCRKGNLFHTVEVEIGGVTMESTVEIPQQVNNRTTIRSSYFWLFGVPHVSDLSKQ